MGHFSPRAEGKHLDLARWRDSARWTPPRAARSRGRYKRWRKAPSTPWGTASSRLQVAIDEGVCLRIGQDLVSAAHKNRTGWRSYIARCSGYCVVQWLLEGCDIVARQAGRCQVRVIPRDVLQGCVITACAKLVDVFLERNPMSARS